MRRKPTPEMDRWYSDYIAKFKAEAERKDGWPRTMLIAALFASLFPEHVGPTETSPDDFELYQESIEDY